MSTPLVCMLDGQENSCGKSFSYLFDTSPHIRWMCSYRGWIWRGSPLHKLLDMSQIRFFGIAVFINDSVQFRFAIVRFHNAREPTMTWKVLSNKINDI